MTSFNNLWRNYPESEKIKMLCTNKQKDSNKPFSDYCAISLSECFIKSGIDIRAHPENRDFSQERGATVSKSAVYADI